jgi:hypothetical protein
MQTVLRHLGFHLRQFHHLVAPLLLPVHCTLKSDPAVVTVGGVQLHHLIHLGLRVQDTMASRMPRLATALPPRGAAIPLEALEAWRVGGRRPGGVLGVLAQSGLQFLDPGLQLFNAGLHRQDQLLDPLGQGIPEFGKEGSFRGLAHAYD